MGKKSVNNLYKPMLEHSNVEQKFHKAAKGKTERPDVAMILDPNNIQRHVNIVIDQGTVESSSLRTICGRHGGVREEQKGTPQDATGDREILARKVRLADERKLAGVPV